jgi:formate dehydrogenase major subunit
VRADSCSFTEGATQPPAIIPRNDLLFSGVHKPVMANGNESSPKSWPVLRQLQQQEAFGLGEVAASGRSKSLEPRTKHADKVVGSVCPYCAVGCAQLVYVKDEKIIDIEGDPGSPISNGCLCPKGAATFQLVTSSHRVSDVLYRKAYGTEWEKIPLEQAMDMVAERVKKMRDATWEDKDEEGAPLRRTLGIAHLGGATLDNEENYLIKKLFTSLGIVQIENQARI